MNCLTFFSIMLHKDMSITIDYIESSGIEVSTDCASTVLPAKVRYSDFHPFNPPSNLSNTC